MLQAPSPTKATSRPARVPTCSRTVCRSASSWQGWNSSVSALTTGTPAWPAIVSRSAWSAVRHTIGGGLPAQHPGDVLDGLALADRGQAAVDDHRVAAELGDAGGERRLGAQGRAGRRRAPRCAGRRAGGGSNGAAFIAAARSRTSACSAGVRSSSREEVAGHARPRSSARAPRGSRPGGQERVDVAPR